MRQRQLFPRPAPLVTTATAPVVSMRRRPFARSLRRAPPFVFVLGPAPVPRGGPPLSPTPTVGDRLLLSPGAARSAVAPRRRRQPVPPRAWVTVLLTLALRWSLAAAAGTTIFAATVIPRGPTVTSVHPTVTPGVPPPPRPIHSDLLAAASAVPAWTACRRAALLCAALQRLPRAAAGPVARLPADAAIVIPLLPSLVFWGPLPGLLLYGGLACVALLLGNNCLHFPVPRSDGLSGPALSHGILRHQLAVLSA